MNKKVFSVILLCMFLALACGGLADGGTGSDPAVSLSYINEVFVPEFQKEADARIQAGLGKAYNEAFASLAEKVGVSNFSRAVSDSLVRSSSGEAAFKHGDQILSSGSLRFTLKSGSATALGTVFTGENEAVSPGAHLQEGQAYYADNNGGFTAVSDVSVFDLDGSYLLTYSSAVDYTSAADVLYHMGLFRGRTEGYALPANATRAEGLVMFLRLIGEESAALSYTGPQPFTDAGWADRYIAYAYSKGYTKGISSTKFGLNDPLSAAHYITFIFRALGYRESVDFEWATVMDDAVSAGLISPKEKESLTSTFTRAQVAYMSYWALYKTLYSQNDSILTRLIAGGVLTEDRALEAISISKVTKIQ